MFRWRISIFGKTPARSLGTITAPDDEATARTKAIEYFHIEPALQFRVVVTKLEKVKAKEAAKA
jgi:GTP-binding protein EngB required for normal cell division